MHTTCVLVWLAVWVLFFVHEVIIVTQVVVPLALQPFYFFYHSHISVFCGYFNLNSILPQYTLLPPEQGDRKQEWQAVRLPESSQQTHRTRRPCRI